MALAIAYCLTLLWFVGSMPSGALSPEVKAEAIVVLTGGKARVEHGLDMLAAKAAPVLFISGVGEHVTEAQILAEHGTTATLRALMDGEGEIILDRVSKSTVSNADQTNAFLKKRGIHRIRLITANYHMKRATQEFRDANPELVILADPVFPEEFRRENWWRHDNTRRLVFSEFYKYLAVLLRDAVRPGS